LVRDLALLSKVSWEDEELWGTIKDVPGPGGRTRLMYAASFGLLVRAQWLLDRGANVNASLEGGCTPLMLASQHGEESMVDKLAFNKAHLDEVCWGPEGDTSTALMMACHAGHYFVALSLRDLGADPNVAGRLSGYTALMWAIRMNHAIIVFDLLEDPRVSPHTRCAGGMTALMLAAELGQTKVVAEMCDHKWHSASLNDTDEDGANALLWACQMGHEEVAFFLAIQKGVQVNVTRASDGMTPLLWAATRGWGDVVEELCKGGAEVNVRETSTGRTPLMMAAANGDVHVLHILYLHGADTELATRKEGMTALMLAAFQGHLEEVVYLVDKGKANIDAVDKRGFTALFWAKLCKRGEVVRFLQSKNAKGSATKVVVMPESSGAGEAGGGDGQV
jgi:ankyrin repeat protein